MSLLRKTLILSLFSLSLISCHRPPKPPQKYKLGDVVILKNDYYGYVESIRWRVWDCDDRSYGWLYRVRINATKEITSSWGSQEKVDLGYINVREFGIKGLKKNQ